MLKLKPILDIKLNPCVGDINKLVNNAMAAIENNVKSPWGKKDLNFTIKFSDDSEIHKLNCEFRGKDKPTNVLSFPYDDIPMLESDKEDKYIGDVIISVETLQREAKEQNKSFDNHLTHLLVHSVLHLYGYDHINDDDARVMEGLEVAILEELNISDPYNI